MRLQNHVFDHETQKSGLFPCYRQKINDFLSSDNQHLDIFTSLQPIPCYCKSRLGMLQLISWWKVTYKADECNSTHSDQHTDTQATLGLLLSPTASLISFSTSEKNGKQNAHSTPTQVEGLWVGYIAEAQKTNKQTNKGGHKNKPKLNKLHSAVLKVLVLEWGWGLWWGGGGGG